MYVRLTTALGNGVFDTEVLDTLLQVRWQVVLITTFTRHDPPYHLRSRRAFPHGAPGFQDHRPVIQYHAEEMYRVHEQRFLSRCLVDRRSQDVLTVSGACIHIRRSRGLQRCLGGVLRAQRSLDLVARRPARLHTRDQVHGGLDGRHTLRRRRCAEAVSTRPRRCGGVALHIGIGGRGGTETVHIHRHRVGRSCDSRRHWAYTKPQPDIWVIGFTRHLTAVRIFVTRTGMHEAEVVVVLGQRLFNCKSTPLHTSPCHTRAVLNGGSRVTDDLLAE
mmetsp:Transcript_18268/g.42668  ORF Transcript_18268/g.42668 Transcript_18268/m.42668 type:complete len:275 (+) Transcript_18268:4083-4907(+)